MKHSQNLSMQDLFTGDKVKNIFPQFKKSKLQNVYSFKETEERVLKFLRGLLKGSITNKTDLKVKGQHKAVLRQVQASVGIIESMFNSTPAITKNIRKNAKLYLPFSSIDELKEIKDVKKKLEVIKMVMDNINYNPDFQSQNSVKTNVPMSYIKRQEAWKKKVNYKEQ